MIFILSLRLNSCLFRQKIFLRSHLGVNSSVIYCLEMLFWGITVKRPGGGALGYFGGGYVPPGTPNWHPVLKKNCPKIDTPF